MGLINIKIQKRKIAFLALLSIGIICFTIVIYMGTKKRDFNTMEELSDNKLAYITKQVIDYPEDINSQPLIWETFYYTEEAVSVVYGNGKEIRRFNGGNAEKIVDFSPEAKDIPKQDTVEAKLYHDIGIIYNMNPDQSCHYIAGQIGLGYRIIRKVLTANYAEVYLMSPENKLIRILALSDKMLMSELSDNAVLDDIESYFK